MSRRTTALDTEHMPPGIPWIIGNEAAERFSFYGMRTILVVFMAKYLYLMDGAGGTPMAELVDRLTSRGYVEKWHSEHDALYVLDR